MNASALGMLDAIQAEQVNMSIRLRSDGLTFALSTPNRGEELREEKQTLSFERGLPSLEQALEQMFYLYPDLTLPYRAVHIAYTPLCSVLVPTDLYQDDDADQWFALVVGSTCLGEAYAVLSHPLPSEGKVLLSAIPRGLHGYLRRTYLQLEFTPYYLPILEIYQRKSRESSGEKLCLILRSEGMDCLALCMGELRLINTFSWTKQADATSVLDELLFYTFSLWRSLSLDPRADELVLLASSLDHPMGLLSQEAQVRLSEYIAQVSIDYFHFI